MIFYLAMPNDAVKDGEQSALGRLRDRVKKTLEDQSIAHFDPIAPYGEPMCAPRAVYDINEAALRRCDGLLAIWPDGVQSVGVPMEIQTMHIHGRPVAVVGGQRSLQLRGMGIATFSDAENAVLYLKRKCAMPTVARALRAVTESLGIKPSNELELPTIEWVGDPECHPVRSYDGDAGWDLIVERNTTVPVHGFVDVSHGISVALPEGYWALITGRSSTIRQRGLLVVNGIIDNGYRGPLFAAVQHVGDGGPVELKRGERIAQLIPYKLEAPSIYFEQVEELEGSDRGLNAFGSTGA